MIEQLISLRQDRAFTLIVDEAALPCDRLVSSVVHHRRQAGGQLICVSPAGRAVSDPADLPQPEVLCSRPGWNSPAELRERLSEAVGRLQTTGSLVLEDVSPLLHVLGTSALCQAVHTVTKSTGGELVACVGSAAVSEEAVERLGFYATHLVRVTNTEPTGDGSADLSSTVSLTCRHRPGRVLTSVERVRLAPDLRVSGLEVLETSAGKSSRQQSVPAQSQQPSMDQLTTFSLSLSDQERRSRDQLVLPYLRPEQRRDGVGEVSSASASGGRIFYQPDAADDWDEEDPDDDLDI